MNQSQVHLLGLSLFLKKNVALLKRFSLKIIYKYEHLSNSEKLRTLYYHQPQGELQLKLNKLKKKHTLLLVLTTQTRWPAIRIHVISVPKPPPSPLSSPKPA